MAHLRTHVPLFQSFTILSKVVEGAYPFALFFKNSYYFAYKPAADLGPK